MPVNTDPETILKILTGEFLTAFVNNEENYYPSNKAHQDKYLRTLNDNLQYFKNTFTQDPKYRDQVITPYILEIIYVLEEDNLMNDFDDQYRLWEEENPRKE